MICSDDPRAQAMRPAGPVHETRHAFAFVAPEPFPDGRGRNTYGAGYGAAAFRPLGALRQSGLACSASSWHSCECSRVGLLSLWRFANFTNLSFSP